MGVDEQRWVSGLRAGEVAAFDAVYHAYAPRLRPYLVRQVGRADVADELLQEAFLRLARKSPDLRPDTQLGAWLFTVARNLSVSYHRWRWLDASRLFEVARRASPRDPARALEARQTAARLDAAIAALPEAQREALMLVTVDGLEPSEAASVVGCTPETLRQRLSRARAAVAASTGGAP